ncbi:peptidase M24, structural domain-containing protein [Leucosporidium creatinivorum]|uniref:Peptidase M24, structural domain-containing protein n=1 Tax=Leucosporidium creatinivorum TaxID=106004 RepID=A0A1Y2ENC7_9BASI|nr:peptidase M24, structural domain-containing protein [Leucosporidium creatinivorum]
MLWRSLVSRFNYTLPTSYSRPIVLLNRCSSSAAVMRDTTKQLADLRALLKRENVDAYVVDSGDNHASEYVSEADKRREWLSGFTGSAGTAVILEKEAWLFTDGRYHLQASQELCPAWTLHKHGLPDVKSWQEQLANLPPGSRIGLDPSLISIGDHNTILPTLSKDSTLVPISKNLVDEVWADKLKRPAEPIVVHEKYSGKSIQEKLEEIRKELRKKKENWGIVVALLDEICWTLNLRGSDIAYNPVFFAHLVIPTASTSAPTLFVDIDQLPQATYDYLMANNILLEPYGDVVSYLQSVGRDLNEEQRVVLPSKTNLALALAVGIRKVDASGRGVIADLKGIKNSVEIEGFRQSHLRDGVALVRYFSWLERRLASGEPITESQAADKLEEFRSELEHFKGLSFETISSTGANAAIIHYAPSPTDSAIIDKDQIYLCDSGAQFTDGTTDTTRTLHFGTPTEREKRAFTRVLQGHIAIDSAIFPETTTGFLLDTWARKALWKDGLDYRHGTGHGIGSHLNVHEGPHGIGTRIAYNEVKLQAGHVVSNEPGYYEDGAFGIRIENVVVVQPADTPNNFGGTKFFRMERFTMVPISTNLVDARLLSSDELEWLNEYNEEVRSKLSPRLEEDPEALAWLEKETKPLSR